MSNKNFSTQAQRMFSFNKGTVNKNIEPNVETGIIAKKEMENEQISKETKKSEPIEKKSETGTKIEDRSEKTTKLTIEIPLSASLKINRIVDERKLNGEKYSKQKFLTEAVLEAIEKN